MKNIIYLTGLLMLVGVGCSSVLTNTSTVTTDSSTSSTIIQDTSIWDGTWVMKNEVAESPVGDLTNPATNKILVINNDDLVEDYSALQGLGDCTSVGKNTYTLEMNGQSAVATFVAVEVDPYIDCRGVAGTSAVPRSFKEKSWDLTINGDTLTASATYGPSTVVQTYQR